MQVIPGPGDFYQLIKPPDSVRKWIQYDIENEYRYYDKKEEGYWYIHKKYVVNVVELAYKKLGYVDWSALPVALQMQIALEKENWRVNKKNNKSATKPIAITTQDAYTVLYLLPSVPDHILDIMWHSLARISHPDQGGDEETFKKYNEAYQIIKKGKNE